LISDIKNKACIADDYQRFSLEDFAEKLVSAGLDELNYLWMERVLHDQIRGLPGLSERIIRGLEKVNSCKLSAGKNKPLINLQCTLPNITMNAWSNCWLWRRSKS